MTPPATGRDRPLRIGFVSVVRPAFKGSTSGASERSLAGLERLGEALGFEVVASPLVAGDASSAGRAADALRGRALDLLLVQHTTFATGDLLTPLLGAARRIGLWALPESAAQRGPSGPLPLNSVCGLNMTLSFLRHPAVDKREPVKWFYGEVDDAWFRERLAVTLVALRALRAVEGARILQIGGTAPAFYGIEERPELASVTVDSLALESLFERVGRVDDAEAAALAERWANAEALDAPAPQLASAARIALGLEELASEGDYHALAVRCWPELPERCDTMACAAMGRLGDHDLPAACEGDVMGALSMLALQGASGAPAILMDLSDLDTEGDGLQFWHCGNAPLAWADRDGQGRARTRLTTHFNRDGVGVVRDMALRSGAATGFRLLEGGRRALIAGGTFGPPERAGFDGVRGWLGRPHWLGEPLGARAFLANVLDYRLPHHIAFGSGELTDALVECCAWLGAEPLPARPLRATLVP